VWRAPILLLLVAALVAGVAIERGRDDAPVTPVRVTEMAATAAPADTLSSTWYCAAGTATGVLSGEGAGVAEQVVQVANASDSDATGTVTLYPEGAASVEVPIAVAAHSRSLVRVSDHVTAPWAAAMVEVSGGEITVAHELTGPTGRSVSDCASAPGSTWYFPAGTTRTDTEMWLALFNPFPGEAVLDLAFDTPDGARTPQDFQGLVVPGGTLVVKKVSDVVTQDEHVSTTISARSGRVVAEQVQSLQVRDGGTRGLTATLGATTPSPTWMFPMGPSPTVEAAEQVAVFNPGDADVEVLVQVQLQDPAANGTVEPFEVTVPAHRFTVVDVVPPDRAVEGADNRVPQGIPHWVVVTSPDGADVVAQRSITGPAGDGYTTTIGLPVVATRWLAPVATTDSASVAHLAVANPSPTDTATVSLRRSGGGSAGPVEEAAEISVAPGQWVVFDLVAAGFVPGDSVEVTSDVGVVVGQWLAFTGPADVATPLGVPVDGTQWVPTEVVGPAVPEELDPDQLAPTETFDQSTVDGEAEVDTTTADTTTDDDGSASSTTTTTG